MCAPHIQAILRLTIHASASSIAAFNEKAQKVRFIT
jgi:hypothetical protein